MNSKVIVSVVIILVAIGAFFGGIQYQKSTSSAGGQFQRGYFGQRFGANAQAVRGQVINVDTANNSISIQKRDGSSAIVLYSSSTSINKAVAGTSADLKNGEQVNVVGPANSDGSVTAQIIQINPGMRGGNGNSGTPSAQ